MLHRQGVQDLLLVSPVGGQKIASQKEMGEKIPENSGNKILMYYVKNSSPHRSTVRGERTE